MFANSFDVDRAVFRFRDADNYNDCAHRPSGPLHRQFGQLHRSSGPLHWPSSPFFCSLKTPTTVFLVQIKLCRCTKSAVVPLCEIVDSRMTRHFAFAAQIIGVKIGDIRHFRASGWRYLHRFSVCPQLVDAVEVNKRCQTRKQGAVRLGSGGPSGLGGKGPSCSGTGTRQARRQRGCQISSAPAFLADSSIGTVPCEDGFAKRKPLGSYPKGVASKTLFQDARNALDDVFISVQVSHLV